MAMNKLNIEQLENSIWPEPDFPSSLVAKCHALRKIPICEMSAEDLRLLIGQKIGLPFIVPVALEILLDDPICAGTFHGDLLLHVLRIETSFWNENPMLYQELVSVVSELEQAIAFYHDDLKPLWIKLCCDVNKNFKTTCNNVEFKEYPVCKPALQNKFSCKNCTQNYSTAK